MSIDARFCLLAGGLVWVTIPFFLLATGFRVFRWLRVPRSAVRLGLFSGREPRWQRLGKDSFLFPQVLELDRRMWAAVIAFHLAGVILLVGHLRLVVELAPLARAFGEAGLEQLAFALGGAVAVVMLVAALYFLARRLTPPARSLSTTADYFLLALVLLVLTSGTIMRFFGHVPVTVYRDYVRGLLSFDAYLPAALDSSVARWSLGLHLLLANLLIVYFPLSKLMHAIGALATNLIRSEHLRSERS